METNLKQKKVYKINIKYPLANHPEWRILKGYKVVIQGFEEFELFVHRRIEPFSENRWRISEATTGFAFPVETDGVTRQETIDNVSKFLLVKGKDKLLKAMEKARQSNELLAIH